MRYQEIIRESSSIRDQYADKGVDGYYSADGDSYQNPHAADVLACLTDLVSPSWRSVLDLACGDGLVTRFLGDRDILGCDPYLASRYTAETGRPAVPHTFQEIARNPDVFGRVFDAVICSYAMDLVPSTYMASLLWSLSTIAPVMVTIRPNKHVLESPVWSLEKQIRHGKAVGCLYVIATPT